MNAMPKLCPVAIRGHDSLCPTNRFVKDTRTAQVRQWEDVPEPKFLDWVYGSLGLGIILFSGFLVG